jgi:hypothetical protein
MLVPRLTPCSGICSAIVEGKPIEPATSIIRQSASPVGLSILARPDADAMLLALARNLAK